MQRRSYINRGQRLSPSARKIIKLRARAFASGGASLELQIPTNYVRDISRKLNYDITKPNGTSSTDGASLIMTPNTIGEGKLLNVTPGLSNSDFIATRATTANVVQKDGSIGDSNYNLLQYSEDYTNAIWTKVSTNATINVTTAPNGLFTANKIVRNTTNSVHNITQNLAIRNTQFIFSVYLKAAEVSISRLQLTDNSTGAVTYDVDLSNGTFVTIGSSSPAFDNSSFTIKPIANNWYLCTLIAARNNTGSANTAPVISIGNTSVAGNNVDGLYVWGAQLTTGSSLKDYLKTTNRLAVPSIDYSLGNSLPALLVEPQSTNIIFPSATASTQTRTVTAQPYTLSFYGTGSITLSGVGSGTLNGIGANNLVSLTFTPTAGSLTFTVTGSVTNWQCEAGSVFTSRITTVSATATRNAYTSYVDLFNNSLLNQNNFTLFFEGYLYDGTTTNVSVALSDTTGTSTRANDIGIIDGIKASYCVGGTITSDTTSLSNNTAFKFCIQRSGTSVKFFRNGAQIWSTQTIATFDYRYLVVNNGGSTYNLKRIMLWKHTKSDAECVTLTT